MGGLNPLNLPLWVRQCVRVCVNGHKYKDVTYSNVGLLSTLTDSICLISARIGFEKNCTK